jgi:hypothetical protein
MLAWLNDRWAGAGPARGEPLRSARARPIRAGIAVVLLLPYLSGCYQLVPVAGAALPGGAEASVTLTDLGRVALAPELGNGVRRLDGQVVESSDTSLVMSVRAVHYADVSGSWTWSGEPIAISRAHIAEARERRLSQTRSVLMVAAALVGVALTSLIVISGMGGDPPTDRVPGGNEPGQQ